jgi:hypothetical protein
MKFEDAISKPLRDLFTRLPPVPAAMRKCKTIYEAVRASRGVRWGLPVKRDSAVTTWTLAALVSHEGSRRLLAKYIATELDGDKLYGFIAAAAGTAMGELDRLHGIKATLPKDRKRAFQQNKDAAIRSLKQARHHLAAIRCNPDLMQLLVHSKYELAYELVRDFSIDQHNRHLVRMELAQERLDADGVPPREQFVELINSGIFFSDDPVPKLDDLLQRAITIATDIPVPIPDRHGVRGRFLRRLYSELEGEPMAKVRIAFLSHASEAIFSEPVDKAQIRRMVRDIAEETAARDALLERVGLGKAWTESFLAEIVTRRDVSRQRRRNSQSSPEAIETPETSKQSRSGSGHCEKARNEPTSAKPARGTRRSPTLQRASASKGGVPAHRKKSE